MEIGFSERISLKQALRGMCISQAAVMAAMKRLSLPASPRISETGKPVSLNGPQAESTSYSSEIVTRCNQDSVLKKATTQSSCPSPGYVAESSLECISSELGNLQTKCSGYGRVEREEDLCFEEPENNSASFKVKNGKKLSHALNDATTNASKAHNTYKYYKSEPDKKISSSNKVRQKPKLQNVSSSSPLKSNKDVKLTKTANSLKNIYLVLKKPKKVFTNPPREDEENSKKPGQNSPQLICQKCQCSMENRIQDPVEGPPLIPTVKPDITQPRYPEARKAASAISAVARPASVRTAP